MSKQADIVTRREEAARAGEQIYDQRLKLLLEPAHNGHVVAIHLPSQEYFLGDSLLEAADRLRQNYPNAARGEVYARGVGAQRGPRPHAARRQNLRVKGKLSPDHTAYVEVQLLEAGGAKRSSGFPV